METEPRTTIAVTPAAALAARPRLFAALEDAFPVRFAAWPAAGADALIDFGGGAGPAEGLPRFVVAGDEAATAAEDVELLDTAGVDRRVRGIVLADRLAPGALDAESAEVLALAPSGPAWTRSGDVHRVRSLLPELADDQVLYSLLSQRAIGIVALIHFLRSATEHAGWRPAPIRASIVFDDPNLRWRSYGFIDYARLVEHADEHDYHASMAMIPLDAHRSHGPTVSLFKRRRDRLSLVFHGNDHAKHELLTPRPAAEALALAAQAVRRIERFERRSGLPVDRVMMPPHGLTSEEVTRALGAVGFDALCGIHPLPWTSEWPRSPLLAGWRPAEYIGGCAVVARFPLVYDESDIALRALLDHPIVLYGHHDDLAEGLEPLAVAAARVNRLGDVDWTPVGDLVLGNYALRVAGGQAVVRPYSRRLRVTALGGAETLTVEAPSPTHGEIELTGWSIGAETTVRPFGSDAAVPATGPLELRLRGLHDVDPAAVAAPGWRPWAQMRRTATEVRDRALPLRPARAS